MLIEANYWKDGKHWVIEAPALDVVTQGTSKANAFDMLADAIRELVNRPGFAVTVTPESKATAVVEASDDGPLIALLLKALRTRNGLSLADVAKRLGQDSRNAYARYEQGKAAPSPAKLDALFKAAAGDNQTRVVIRAMKPAAPRRAKLAVAAR